MSLCASSLFALLCALLLSDGTHCLGDDWNPEEDLNNAVLDHGTASHLVARARYASQEGTINNQCAADFYTLETAMKRPENYSWAARMANADGEFPLPGLYQGAKHAVGSYVQCLKVHPTGQAVNLTDEQWENSTVVGIHLFGSSYCRMTWAKHNWEGGFSLGVCVPDSCTREDILEIMPNGTEHNHKRVYCGSKPSLASNPGGIFAVFFIVVFIILIITASLVDYRLENQKKKKSEEVEMEVEANGRQVTEPMTESQPNEEQTQGREVTEPTTESQTNGEPTPKRPKHKLLQGLLAFSLQRNVASVLSSKGPRATYGCMNGVRFFAFTWIVLGHTWKLETHVNTDPRNTYIANLIGQYFFYYEWTYAHIQTMDFAVDTFFLLCGALVLISFTKTAKRIAEDKGRRKCCLALKEHCLYLIHRYIRLTPVYAAIMIIYANLWMYFAAGPLFPEFQAQADNCRSFWWTNLLYLNGLSMEAPCMGWTWYLATDYGFYNAAPIFIYALVVKRRVGYGLLIGALLGSLALRFILFVILPDYLHFGLFYAAPYTRFGPFAIGLALGYTLQRTNCQVKLRKVVVVICWILATLLSLYALHGTPDHRYRGFYSLFYHSMKRDLMTLGVAWMVFACCTGYGGILNSFLSWKLWLPLSKLSYVGYLIHPIIHVITLGARMQPLHVNSMSMLYWYIGNLTLTIVFSFVLTLAFEVPFMELGKLFIPRHVSIK